MVRRPRRRFGRPLSNGGRSSVRAHRRDAATRSAVAPPSRARWSSTDVRALLSLFGGVRSRAAARSCRSCTREPTTWILGHAANRVVVGLSRDHLGDPRRQSCPWAIRHGLRVAASDENRALTSRDPAGNQGIRWGDEKRCQTDKQRCLQAKSAIPTSLPDGFDSRRLLPCFDRLSSSTDDALQRAGGLRYPRLGR